MARMQIEAVYRGERSLFELTPIDRSRLYGRKRRIGLDASGNECRNAHLTRDGRFVLMPGDTATLYVDEHGNQVDRAELRTTDDEGRPVEVLESTLRTPQLLGAPVTVEIFLSHVVKSAYHLRPLELAPSLAEALDTGVILPIPFIPRRTTSRIPSFLLSNDTGVFLVQAHPCEMTFIGPDDPLTELTELEDEDSLYEPDFGFGDLP
jgi:hypothetical protein